LKSGYKKETDLKLERNKNAACFEIMAHGLPVILKMITVKRSSL
jgi:hypothetical protein